jgi:hypothetical protein
MPESGLTADEQRALKTLRDTVRRREVCWDVYPERVGIRGKTRTVGFEMVLSGIHTPGTGHPTPGCVLCKEAFADLERVARWIIPREERASVHQIQMYQAAIRRAAQRHHRPEVSLSLKILHRQGYEEPIDACERRCLNEMEARLKMLGACPGEWKPRRSPPDGSAA